MVLVNMLIFYGLGLFLVLVVGVAYYVQAFRAGCHDEAVGYARIILLSPLWPVFMVAAIIYGMYRAVVICARPMRLLFRYAFDGTRWGLKD